MAAEHGGDRGVMERTLYAMGSTIGKYPIPTYGVGFCFLAAMALAGWMQFDDPNDAMTDMDFKLLWSNSESVIAKEVRQFLDLHGQDKTVARAKPWHQPYHYTMMVSRKNRGEDIMTPEVHDEIFKLYKKFREINVTTQNGYTYTTDDLCHRGPFPDTPGGVYMPCLTSDTFQCFSEYIEAVHPTYAAIDPIVGNISVLASWWPKSFTERPSYRSMTGAEMKKEISQLSPFTGERGCPAWNQLTTWTTKYWGGDLKWNAEGTEIVHQGGIAWIMYYDGYARATFRMSLMQPEKAILKEVEEAMDLHKAVWSKTVLDFNKNEGKLIEYSTLKPGFVDEIEDKSEEIPWGLLIGGAVLMNIFVFTMNFRCGDHRFSRASLAMNGLFCVLCSTIGGSGFMLVLGFRFNASMIGALPLLSLGLGLDDMFVVIRYFMTFSNEKILALGSDEIIGQVLEEAGPGVFLTSCVNTISFGMGAMLPIPGLATFCIGASIASALNLFTILTLFLPYMCMEISRIKNGRREYPCQAVIEDPAQEVSYQEGWEDKFVKWLETSLAPAMMRPAVRGAIILTFLSIFAVTLYSIIAVKSAGYTPKQIAPHGTNEYLGLEHLFEFFGTFPAWLVFLNVDVPNKQGEMLHFYDELTKSKYCKKHAIMPYLSMLALTNPHLLDNSTYTHPTLAPGGIVNAGSEADWYKRFNEWRYFPVDNPLAAFDPKNWAFNLADLVFVNEFTYHKAPVEFGNSTMEFSFFPFLIENLLTDQDFVDMIKEVREITEDKNKNALGRANAYPYSDMLTFWSVFIDIEPIMMRALLINTGVLFVLTCLFLKSFFVAMVSVLVCVMIVIEVYGVMMFVVQYNVFVATGLIAASGLAIEDVAHFVASFMLTKGSTQKKLATAMTHTYVAIILGSISTFLALLPLAGHWMDFIILYQFLLFIVLVVLGVLNGTLFLPALLAAFGSCTETKGAEL